MGIYIRKVKNNRGKITEYYCIDYMVNGKRRYETVGKKGLISKYEARELLAERKRQIRLGQLGLAKAKIPTLNEFIPEYAAYLRDIKRNRECTKAEYAVRVFRRYFGERRLSEITAVDIDDFKKLRMGEGKKPSTVNVELAYVKGLFNQARKRKKYFSPTNPVSEAGLIPNVENRRERVLSPEEEQRLLDCCPDFLKPLVLVALNTGMRKNELRLLKREDIDFTNNLITIQQTNSKNKKQRRIPINAVIRKVLLEQTLRSNSEYIFGEFARSNKMMINYFF